MSTSDGSSEAARASGGAGPGDEALRALLAEVRRIAVLGIKEDPGEDAHRVAAYLARVGYEILPVNPKLERVLDRPCAATLAQAAAAELIDVFRAPRHLPSHVDEILSLTTPPRAVWFQLGIRDDAAAARLEAAGITVVQDRCLMVEHARLLGATGAGAADPGRDGPGGPG